MSNAQSINITKSYGDSVFLQSYGLLKNYIKKETTNNLIVFRNTEWVNALTKTLKFSTNINLIPVVSAKEPIKPKKPPPMGFKDLPIYKSPHCDYKEYVKDSQKCEKSNESILRGILFPKVAKTRNKLKSMVFGMTDELKLMKNEAVSNLGKNYNGFIKYMRSPDNESLRKGVVVTGTGIGAYMASGTRSISKKSFGGIAGAIFTGALCFPKETDEAVRNVSFFVFKAVMGGYGCMCPNKGETKERLPCPRDVPRPLPKVDNKKCAEKKK